MHSIKNWDNKANKLEVSSSYKMHYTFTKMILRLLLINGKSPENYHLLQRTNPMISSNDHDQGW